MTMRLAIMQPYFLPYIGYFQLLGAVDAFVVYDNIKYTKSGWINRNRFLMNGQAEPFSVPLKKDSDSRFVVERTLATDFDREHMLARFRNAYRKAPQFDVVMPLLERVVRHGDNNLFAYIHHSLREVAGFLGIATPVIVSSSVGIDHDLKGQDKVLALCGALGADTYINAIGGLELYSREAFRAKGITLHFLRARPFEYAQFGNAFVPWLSIVDVLMFNAPEVVRERIASGYDLE